MADDRAPWESPAAGRYDPAAENLDELRELLLGAERRRLRELERRLDAAGLTREELAELLPEAIALRAGRDRQLARALAPTVESAIGESVRRNPREIASAIFPVLGPAIRKAIAEALAGLVASINSTIEHSLSPRGLKWRLEAWRTGVPYAQIVLKHALVYRVEQVFLIHADTGLLLAHAWAPELPASDADLISGMLTAIRDFVADSFARERDAGGLRQFSVGELTIMVEHGPRALIAAVVRGQAPDTFLVKLQDTLEAIHLQFAGALAEFDGDAAAFAAARPLLEACLATVVATDRSPDGRRPMAWIPWAAAALLIVGTLAWRTVRSEHRWSSAIARLQSQPGIVLTRAERDGGRWSFSGLHDPLAARPALLLAGVVDTTRIEQHWEPYISLQPELVLARARKILAPPATVALSLAGDTLHLRGPAPLAWLGTTARRAALPPGLAALDLSGIEPQLPASLAELETEIEAERVLFDIGSASAGSVARATVARVAASFARLEADAAANGSARDPRADRPHRPDRIRLRQPGAEPGAGRNGARAPWRAACPSARTRVTAAGTTRPLAGRRPGRAGADQPKRLIQGEPGLGCPGREPTR